MSSSLLVLGQGLLTGLSLIIAIGAQNAYVLRQGLLRQHELPIALLCSVADALLIVAGVAGIGAVVQTFPVALDVLRWAGVAFLVWCGIGALRRAMRPEAMRISGGGGLSLGRALTMAAALTFLNPHVYLDTMIFLGSIANQHGPDQRWWFAVGATTASFLWFFGLALAARRLAPLFSRPATWRVLDGFVALVMFVVAGFLVATPLH